jgi:chromosome partitioning protein
VKIISVWCGKGGVGKSSLVLAIASCLSSMGFKVGVVDLDEQRSCLTFAKGAEDCGFDVLSAYPEDKPDYDFLLCDHSPERTHENDPLKICDLVIIPILPSALDAWSVLPAIEALDKRHVYKKMIVVNRYQKNRRMGDEFMDVVSHDFVVSERSIYQRTIANFSPLFKPQGFSLFSYGLKDAQKEIKALVDKMIETLNGNNEKQPPTSAKIEALKEKHMMRGYGQVNDENNPIK